MPLRVFVDLTLPQCALTLLRDGTPKHQLALSEKPTSVLTASHADPQLSAADVAFGQPDVGAIASSVTLKWIHVASSGITRYDTREFRGLAAERGLVVTNSATVYREPCALHALSFMVAEARNLPTALATRTPGSSSTWDRLRQAAVSLAGQTLLIVGYGSIGSRLAELVAPMGLRVLGFRQHPRGDEGVPLVSHGSLRQALRSADHVMNILPLSPTTLNFFDHTRFQELKPGAVFYNIGRGATVDQTALLHALESGRLKAAWLDVTEPEPLPTGHPLLDQPNCHITPHVAGGHADEAQALVRHFLRNLERFEQQQPLLDRVM